MKQTWQPRAVSLYRYVPFTVIYHELDKARVAQDLTHFCELFLDATIALFHRQILVWYDVLSCSMTLWYWYIKLVFCKDIARLMRPAQSYDHALHVLHVRLVQRPHWQGRWRGRSYPLTGGTELQRALLDSQGNGETTSACPLPIHFRVPGCLLALSLFIDTVWLSLFGVLSDCAAPKLGRLSIFDIADLTFIN